MQKDKLVEGITSKILTPKQGPKARDHPLVYYEDINQYLTCTYFAAQEGRKGSGHPV